VQNRGKQPQSIGPATIGNIALLDFFRQHFGLHRDNCYDPAQGLARKHDLQIVWKFVPSKAHDVAWFLWPSGCGLVGDAVCAGNR
jgi:hypothetical protein